MEIWKDIKDYEGLYQVSNYGRVRSLNYRNTGRVEVLKSIEEQQGYLQIHLVKNKKRATFKIHRLVAETFIQNPERKPQVNHKDEDKTNNRVENLEWCCCNYNINYGTRTNRATEKLSKIVLQLTTEGEILKEWPSAAEAGRNGFNQGNIVSCCNGKLKTYKGYIWKYKEVV